MSKTELPLDPCKDCKLEQYCKGKNNAHNKAITHWIANKEFACELHEPVKKYDKGVICD